MQESFQLFKQLNNMPIKEVRLSEIVIYEFSFSRNFSFISVIPSKTMIPSISILSILYHFFFVIESFNWLKATRLSIWRLGIHAQFKRWKVGRSINTNIIGPITLESKPMNKRLLILRINMIVIPNTRSRKGWNLGNPAFNPNPKWQKWTSNFRPKKKHWKCLSKP